MTLLTTSLLDTKAYDFSVLRYMSESLIVQSGVVNKGDYLVTAKASQPPMGVSVAAGAAWVKASTGTRNGAYHVVNDGSVDITLTAADVTNPRVDRIILRVADTSDLSSATDTATLEVVSGTPTSGATLANLNGAAAQPANTLNLAFVLVGASVTSVVGANIGNWLDPIGTAAGTPVVSGAVTTAAPAFALGRAANTTPYLVSTLPASPFDGQEVYYQSTTAGTGGGASDSMADVGAAWHLRYRSASSSAFKWEVVGASPISHEVSTSQNTSSATFVALTTAGPTVKVALAGDYIVSVCAFMDNYSNNSFMSFDIGAIAAIEDNGAIHFSSGFVSPTNGGKLITAAADDAITAKYKRGAAGLSTFKNRRMTVTPIRVG